MFEGLKPREKAEFFTVLRDFDSALTQYEGVIKNSAADEVFELEKAVRGGIAMAVRVKKDPARAREFVNLILKRKDLPFYIKEKVAPWEVDLKAWEKEPKSTLTGIALLRRAKRLSEKAASVQASPVDRSADILYLRATADLHDYLGKLDGKGEKSADASYLLGVGYEERVYFGYSGSSGTFVPADVRERLSQFEVLALKLTAVAPMKKKPRL